MNIHLVISFNDSFTIPAGVCITSLAVNAKPDSFYNIHILFSRSRLSDSNQQKIRKLESRYKNISLTFIDVDDAFKNGFEIRNVTIETYYRLLIPAVFTDIEKILYLDVDTIINTDLSNLFNTDIENYHLAGAREFFNTTETSQSRYIKTLQLNPTEYINAGILLFNLKYIRKELDSYNDKIHKLATLNLTYQDQDILNIIFKNSILYIEHSYNYTFPKLLDGLHITTPDVIHYILEKPWDTPRPFGDIWWNYYKNSMFFDKKYYLKHQIKAFKNLDTHLKIGRLLYKLGFNRLISFKRHIHFLFRKIRTK
ncbi:glycosyltransferase family 8 protein [Carboxylicivirga sp. A043]|uniref:glycosyltransferase family 8 protein n=1 Tax=Carboxylicivirga litoralis TaxID=2816963 RepID=UPI0021CB2F93|nr:glycosyltransferase family 8 protein [Carboxylicivirga sp. A043]MCU4156571.1 glycosyltransferase family 8 protein [Carboxylicivirga sp. A043]